MRRLCAGQVFEAPKAHRSKNLDEVVRPAHRGVEPRRLRYDQRRDTNRGPKKCAGCSPPGWLSTRDEEGDLAHRRPCITAMRRATVTSAIARESCEALGPPLTPVNILLARSFSSSTENASDGTGTDASC